MALTNKLRSFGWFAVLLLQTVCGISEGHSPWFAEPPKAEIVNAQLPATIKVGLMHSKHTLSIGCTGLYMYTAPKKSKPVLLTKKTTLRFKGVRHGMTLKEKMFKSGVQVSPLDANSFLTVNGRAYRGTLLINPRGNGIVDVIETVNLEDYLYGVLPREVGVDWPAEALKAQAVISRTFVLANLGKYADHGYDVSNDVYSQVYGGYQDENPATSKAVDDTRGEILMDEKGAPVEAFFHSSCGGRTENPQYVWQEMKNPPAYLNCVRDTFCKDDPFNHWDFDIAAETLQRRLRRINRSIGTLKNISIASHSPSGRASAFEVESSRGRVIIPGNAFRLAVGPEELRSTLITTIKRKGQQFHFEGKGWGHGVGLCQWGARGRALAGQSYEKILDAYYQNVRLVKAGPPANVPLVSNSTGTNTYPDNASMNK